MGSLISPWKWNKARKDFCTGKDYLFALTYPLNYSILFCVFRCTAYSFSRLCRVELSSFVIFFLSFGLVPPSFVIVVFLFFPLCFPF